MKPLSNIKNRNQFLNESKETTILYHGSNKLFDMFDDSMISSGDGSDMFGKGYYLTDNKDIAEFYARLRAKKDRVKEYTPTGIFGTEEPVYHSDADEYAAKNKYVNEFKVNGNILNAQEYIIDEKLADVLKDSYVKHSGWGEEGREIVERTLNYVRNNKEKIDKYRGELHYLITRLALTAEKEVMDDVLNYIKGIGYDGIKYKPNKTFEGNDNYWNYVIYNKNVLSKAS